jgi:branched-chain amino acid transport system ATP-binding protein
MSALLDVEGLSVTFGGLHAVAGLGLTVEEGTLVGLIGPNGAGKTTCIDALTGFVPSRGRITFAGTDVTGARPHQRARLGLGRTWQSLELFDDLTVRENLQVAAEPQSLGGFLADFVHPARRRDRSGVDFALDALGIGDLADHMPGGVSQGQRKLIGVARALASRPRLVCMDEPAAGLDSTESRQLGRQLRRLVDGGTTVLLVDHDMGLVLDVCDHVYVIEYGRRIADGPPREIARDPVVVEAYLGTSAEQVQP